MMQRETVELGLFIGGMGMTWEKYFITAVKKGRIILDRTMMRWCDRLEPITFYISYDMPRGRLWTRLLHIDIVVGPGEHVDNEILDSASLDLRF